MTLHSADPKGPVDRLRPTVFSTRHLAPHQQFAAYRQECAPWLDTEAPATPGFAIDAETWALGPFALVHSQSPAVSNRRNAGHIRRDQMDHWSINILRAGTLRGRIGDTDIILRPGAPMLLSLREPNEIRRTDTDWLRLFIARDAMPELAPMLDAARNRPLDSGLWRLVGDYLEVLALRLPCMSAEDLPGVIAATRAMIAAAARTGRQDDALALPQAEELTRGRILGLIRQHIGAATLTPDRLCRLAGVSRSQMYRIFEPLGGVARTIQAERLRQAHRCLADVADRRGIQDIAEAFGFFDPSSFSRAFRQAFGVTPTALRRGAPAMAEPAPPVPATGGITQVLRRLGA